MFVFCYRSTQHAIALLNMLSLYSTCYRSTQHAIALLNTSYVSVPLVGRRRALVLVHLGAEMSWMWTRSLCLPWGAGRAPYESIGGGEGSEDT